MKKRTIAYTLFIAGTVGITSLAGSFGSAPPVFASENTTIHYDDQAKAFYQKMLEEKYAEAYQTLNANLKKNLPAELLPIIWQQLLAPYGKPQKIENVHIKKDGVHTNVTLICATEATKVNIILRYDDKGLIDDFNATFDSTVFPYKAPSYDQKTYTEKELVVGSGEFALPAVLAIPKGKGPHPAVVLVHGSGPNDKDETFYSYKVFKDLAAGLASKGIAVLRYDKRTNAHQFKTVLDPYYSIQKETVMDANAAIKLLKTQPGIDPQQLFVFGHSQGAFAMPLILNNDTSDDIRGVINAAGPNSKFHELLLWQTEQILERAKKANAPAEQIKQAEEQVVILKKQTALLNDHSYTTERLPTEFALGNPYWWFDLRDYIPTSLAKKQNKPMLIIQGGKDIQVPPTELDKWKEELKGKSNVLYKLYPNMFHTLGNYSGQPDGITEYVTSGNVSEEMINDVYKWIQSLQLPPSHKVDPSTFTDYKTGQYWSVPFAWALDKGIILGYSREKKLKPGQSMTELQYLHVFFRYILGDSFKDQSQKTVYALAKEKGLSIKNKPYSTLTRGEAAIMLAEAFTQKKLSQNDAIQWLYDQGVVRGYLNVSSIESFRPNEAITRAHLMTMFYHLDRIWANDTEAAK
ncbi:serine aminopeptidase domain-containing protein [Bacillus sp. 1P06AnD]|uniref:serine aminopeptidase domain-containing protein n=1 Tax=Bacillus sp. 1P06AnD TaxID=3132208 RepID=UPI0039A37B4D